VQFRIHIVVIERRFVLELVVYGEARMLTDVVQAAKVKSPHMDDGEKGDAMARSSIQQKRALRGSSTSPNTLPSWNLTRIVCTLGPATDAPGVLEELLSAGMDVARINTSHGTLEEHARRIRRLRGAARFLRRPIAILADLPGAKFRLGQLKGGARTLAPGEQVALSARADDTSVLPFPHPRALSSMSVGQPVFLSDGSVRLRVDRVSSGRVQCEVVAGGTIRSGSGVNLPDFTLPGLVPTPEDRRKIAFAVAERVDWIGVSFVESAADMHRVRQLTRSKNAPLLMAKIERRQAVDELEAILQASDGVMVARGDLGVETDIAEIPLLQKRIIARANAAGRQVVTATQMLESMVDQERPTRAEVTDIANAVLDGSDGVMLSAETAIGRFPALAVETMRRILTATESGHAARIARTCLAEAESARSGDAMSFVACQLAERLAAKGIVAWGSGAESAFEIARFRPAVPLLVATDSQAWRGRLASVRGAAPLPVTRGAGEGVVLALAGEWLRARRLVNPGDALVLLHHSQGSADPSSTLRVARV
jgi:pyruvate kinase